MKGKLAIIMWCETEHDQRALGNWNIEHAKVNIESLGKLNQKLEDKEPNIKIPRSITCNKFYEA